MKYYISINSWNLLESFATESLSPFAFYSKRNFGNNLSRYTSSVNDKINFLVLSSVDNGGDYTIEIDESILDKKSIKPVKNLKTLFTYCKTIYYQVGQIGFRFANQSLLDSFIAESQILFEVKCIEKYLPNFFVKNVKEKKASVTLQRVGESFSFEQLEFISKDDKFNIIKGAIVGYVRGELTASGLDDQVLTSMIKDVKNSFVGLHTQIMINDIEVQNPDTYIVKLRECKKLFQEIRGERTNNFDILSHLFLEIRNLASLRYLELSKYKSSDWSHEYEKLIAQKQDIEDHICQVEIENNITLIKDELEQIKEQERLIGESQGKTRVYFKKGTIEHERKSQLNSILREFKDKNSQYKSLLNKLDDINQQIVNSTSGKTQYDSAISALFSRISDIINDLQKKFEAGKCLKVVDLAPLDYSREGMVRLENSTYDSAEVELFNILLRIIFNKTALEPISDAFILTLIEDAANEYKTTSSATTDKGLRIIACLRDYWKYKHNLISAFSIPTDMPILQSIMSFFLKPFGFDQIERYMLNKKYTEKKYALMLWGAYNGYAALPKTFTAILYQQDSYYSGMDKFLQEIYALI